MPEDATRSESLRIRRATRDDIPVIAEIGFGAFSGLRPLERSVLWVTATFAAEPRTQYWVAEEQGTVVGYILWTEKGGFRSEAVLELEQIAVRPNRRRSGIGGRLITESITVVESDLRNRGSRLKLVEVTTGSDQNALEFYRSTLGAEVVAEIPNYFRGTEYLLIARRAGKDETR